MSKGDGDRTRNYRRFREEWERIFKKQAEYAAPEVAETMLRAYPAREGEDTTREEG